MVRGAALSQDDFPFVFSVVPLFLSRAIQKVLLDSRTSRPPRVLEAPILNSPYISTVVI
jgi:hypothetical protein